MTVNRTKDKNYIYRATAKTIKQMVADCVELFPGNNAFMVKKDGNIHPVTFFQMHKDIQNLGTELFCMELPEFRVGIIGENSYPWFQVFLATVNGGGVAVPFDKGLTPEELSVCINRSRIEAIFFDEKHEKVIREAIALSERKDLKAFQMNGKDEVLSSLKLSGEEKVRTGNTCFADVEVKDRDLAVILFTSGTTSQSKAVMLCHDNIMSNIRGMHNFERMYPWDVNMAFLPCHHSFGLVGVLVFMAAGGCSVFCDGLRYVTKNLAEYGVTVFVGVPLIVENMYKKIRLQIQKQGKEKSIQTGLKLAKCADAVGLKFLRRKIFKQVIDGLGGELRLIICGAAPLAPETSSGFNNFGIDTIQGYGLTETSTVLAAERPEDLASGSVGKPLPNVNIMIAGEDENGVGEIIARGPNIMLGYMDQPEETAKAIRDGWFYTGDLGKFDVNGNLWITGRKKNVIVMKNGKNIFPEEIEGHIDLLPYTQQSMVFTREKHNELVLWAEIVYNPDYLKEHGLSYDEFVKIVQADMAKINETMPSYKYVNHFILTDEPMINTTTQKVKRNLEIEKLNANRENEKWYNSYV